ncbi:hypothetical protein TNIN_139501 [Trichonephila inaurata madagascariensis]|uniref:Uncharacterized protein n=1 Tax=Trichonephila inaurata madagascariensis TaxID=2747483 RepID=A0A8X6X2H3_9ARAC|nr:hypothetical protein TNIN_139501 [Trichonephila inaurata madagascariensis]
MIPRAIETVCIQEDAQYTEKQFHRYKKLNKITSSLHQGAIFILTESKRLPEQAELHIFLTVRPELEQDTMSDIQCPLPHHSSHVFTESQHSISISKQKERWKEYEEIEIFGK